MANVRPGQDVKLHFIAIHPPTLQSGARQSDLAAADLDEAHSGKEGPDEADSDQENPAQSDSDQEDSGEDEIIETEDSIPLSLRLAMLRLLAMDPGPSPSSHPEEKPAVNHTKGSGRTARAALARHKRKCAVCHHPDRETIEQDFLRWCSPDDLARNFGIKWRSTIYRHMHATGLSGQRRANLRFALEPIIEQAYNVRSKADSIIRAVRTYAHINDHGDWVEPVKTLVIGRATLPPDPESTPDPSPAPSPAPPLGQLSENPNREFQILEVPVNDGK